MGVAQGPGGPDEDREGGFEHAGWSVNYWPYSEDPGSAQLNDIRKHVASRTLDKVEWKNSTLLEGDVAEAVARLKQEEGGEIHVTGSLNLIQTLLRHNLIDEIVTWTFPVVVGTGKRLFGEGTVPAGFTVTDTKVSTTGVVIATYTQPAPIEYGSFDLDQEFVSA